MQCAVLFLTLGSLPGRRILGRSGALQSNHKREVVRTAVLLLLLLRLLLRLLLLLLLRLSPLLLILCPVPLNNKQMGLHVSLREGKRITGLTFGLELKALSANKSTIVQECQEAVLIGQKNFVK